MASKDLVYRFFGVDAGAGREFERMAAHADIAGAAWKKYALGAGVAVAAVGAYSIKLASDFQKSTEQLHTQAGVSQAAVEQMRKGILSLAGPTATAPEKLSEALYHIASTGARGAKAMDELKIAAEGAKIGNADLTDVTNALNATIVSGIKGAGSFSHAMGALNAIVGAGDMHMQDLAEALGSGVLAVVKTFGVDLTQAGAALAVFGDNNIRGAQAATYLRQAVQSISVATPKANQALGQINLTADQLQKALAKGGLTGALTLLHERFVTSGIAANRWGTVMEDAFTKKAGTGISVLLTQFGRYQQKLREVDEGGSKFSQAWSAYTKTFSYQWDRMRALVEAFAIKIGNVLIPIATQAVHALADFGTVALPALVGVAEAFGAIAHVAGSTVGFFAHNTVAAEALAGVLAAVLVPKLVEMGIAFGRMIALNAAAMFVVLRGAVIGAAEAFATAGGGAAGFAAALEALNINPVIAVTTALTAAAAGLAYVFGRVHDHYDDITSAGHEYVSALKDQHTSSVRSTADLASMVYHLKALRNAGQENTDQAKALAAGIAEQGMVAARERTNVANLAAEFGVSEKAINRLATAQNINLNSTEDLSGVIAAALSPTQRLKAANAALGRATRGSATAVDALTAKLDLLIGGPLAEHQAAIDFADGIRKIAAAANGNTGKINDNTKAGEANAKMLDDQVGKLQTSITNWAKNSRSQDFMRKHALGLEKQMIATASATTGNGKAVLRYLSSMNATPAQIDKVIGSLHKLTGKMDDTSSEAYGKGEKTGENYAKGLAAGAHFLSGVVATAGAWIANQLDEGARSKQGVDEHSPSKKAIKAGQWYAQGLAIGVNSHGREVYLSGAQVAHQLAVGLTKGWHGEAGMVERTFSQGVQTMLGNLNTRIDNALGKQQALLKKYADRLKQDLQARRQAISSLSGSIAGNAGISNVFGTDDNGNPTIGNVRTYLTGQAGMYQRYAGLFARAKKMGLSPNLLAQISGMAPSDAISILTQITSGQDGSISSLNAIQRSIAASSKQIATGTVNTPHERATLRQDRHDRQRQIHLLESIDGHLQHFREHPRGGAQITLALHQLGFSDHEIRKIMAGINRVESNVGPGLGRRRRG